MAYYFLPPTVEEGPAGGGALFYRYKLTRANSILQRTDGSYYSVRTPSVDETQSALYYYPGGHKNLISDAERTSLIAAGKRGPGLAPAVRRRPARPAGRRWTRRSSRARTHTAKILSWVRL